VCKIRTFSPFKAYAHQEVSLVIWISVIVRSVIEESRVSREPVSMIGNSVVVGTSVSGTVGVFVGAFVKVYVGD
jgi:hypothetical protein